MTHQSIFVHVAAPHPPHVRMLNAIFYIHFYVSWDRKLTLPGGIFQENLIDDYNIQKKNLPEGSETDRFISIFDFF